MGFRRNRQTEKREFVDLETYYSEDYGYDLKVTAVEMRSYEDIKAVSDRVRRGEVIVADTSQFAEGEAKLREAIKEMSNLAHETGGSFSETSGRTVILTPPGVGMEKIRITRRSR